MFSKYNTLYNLLQILSFSPLWSGDCMSPNNPHLLSPAAYGSTFFWLQPYMLTGLAGSCRHFWWPSPAIYTQPIYQYKSSSPKSNSELSELLPHTMWICLTQCPLINHPEKLFPDKNNLSSYIKKTSPPPLPKVRIIFQKNQTRLASSTLALWNP